MALQYYISEKGYAFWIDLDQYIGKEENQDSAKNELAVLAPVFGGEKIPCRIQKAGETEDAIRFNIIEDENSLLPDHYQTVVFSKTSVGLQNARDNYFEKDDQKIYLMPVENIKILSQFKPQVQEHVKQDFLGRLMGQPKIKEVADYIKEEASRASNVNIEDLFKDDTETSKPNNKPQTSEIIIGKPTVENLIRWANSEKERLSSRWFFGLFPLYGGSKKAQAISNAIENLETMDRNAEGIKEAANNSGLSAALKIRRHSWFDALFKSGKDTKAYETVQDKISPN